MDKQILPSGSDGYAYVPVGYQMPSEIKEAYEGQLAYEVWMMEKLTQFFAIAFLDDLSKAMNAVTPAMENFIAACQELGEGSKEFDRKRSREDLDKKRKEMRKSRGK